MPKFVSQYSDDEKHAALELAAQLGVRPAARHLGITSKTLYRWASDFPQLWSDLRAGDTNATKTRVAANLVDLAERYAEAENDLLEKIEDGDIAATDAKEAAALLKAMGSSRQAAVAGARTVSGEPEQHEHTINFPAIEQAMERLLGGGGQNPATPALVVENLAAKDGEHVDAALQRDNS